MKKYVYCDVVYPEDMRGLLLDDLVQDGYFDDFEGFMKRNNGPAWDDALTFSEMMAARRDYEDYVEEILENLENEEVLEVADE